MSKPRVLIALVTMNDAIYSDTVRSLLELDTSDIDIEYGWFTHSITSAARNCAAARCLGQGFSHLLFLDLDMTFDPRTLKRLLSHDVPVVSAMYKPRRGNGGPFFAFRFRDDGIPMVILSVDMTGPELIPVDGVPTGCLLIKREVFEALDEHALQGGATGPSPGQPFFYYEARLDRLIREREEQLCGIAVEEGHVDEDVLRLKPGFGRGEDLRFCASVREAGIPIYLDTRVVCGHLAIRSYGTPAIYD